MYWVTTCPTEYKEASNQAVVDETEDAAPAVFNTL